MKGKISGIILSIEKYADALLTGVVNAIVTLLWTILWFPVAIKEAFNASYYSDRPRKNTLQRLLDNCCWVLRFHRANTFYNLYGLDVKGARTAPYIDEKGFWKGLNQLNYKKGVNSQVCLLRDKYLFYKYMSSNGIAVPEVFGVIRDGKCYDIELNEVNEEFFSDRTNFFVKDIDGECASFVKRVNDYSCLKSYSEAFKHGRACILQDAIVQHPDMNMLNPEAINTLRVITVRDKTGQVSVLSAVLRCGSKMTGNVDNWAAGGLAIGIKRDGYLKKYGFYKPGHGLKTCVHPDTGVVFEKFRIPKLQEAYDCACKAHRSFYGIGAIGWDIAITSDGPCVVEGNDNFEITLMQACDRPLKEAWLKIIG